MKKQQITTNFIETIKAYLKGMLNLLCSDFDANFGPDYAPEHTENLGYVKERIRKRRLQNLDVFKVGYRM